MNSKEALNWFGHELRDNKYKLDQIEQHNIDLMWEKIEQDLERFELLNKYSRVEILGRKEFYLVNNHIIRDKKSQKIIRKWLDERGIKNE